MIENGSRKIVYFNVTALPTAEWTAMRLLQAFPWATASRYLLRARDSIYGSVFTSQVHAMGIGQVITSYKSPWQNPHMERLIGSVRRECLDHVIALNERHLRRVLRDYVEYYHESRTHLGLGGDCPVPRSIEPPPVGPVRKRPMVGGLQHRYYREAA